MSLTLTIAGAAVPFDESTVSIIRKVDERNRLQATILDYLGVYIWQYGSRVVLTDNRSGIRIFGGFLIEDKQNKNKGFPSTLIEHEIDTIADRYLADKRTYSRIYTAPTYAGKILIDHLNDVLSQEKIVQNYALSYDSLASDFNQGILTNTVGRSIIGTGDLELTPAGADLVIVEDTTAQFATGTLTNMQAVASELVPTTVYAIKMQSTLSFSYGTEFAQSQQTASGSASGTAYGTASGSASGSISGSASGSISGSASGTVSGNATGSVSGTASGSISGTVNSSGSYTPGGNVYISGGAPGESASFSGYGGGISVSGGLNTSASLGFNTSASLGFNVYPSLPFSATASLPFFTTATLPFSASVASPFSASVSSTVSTHYEPRKKSKVKVDETHYIVTTVDAAVVDNRCDSLLWVGTYTIPANDVLNYDIWIASTSPSYEAGIDFYFSDGTALTEYIGQPDVNFSVGLWDQNALSVSPIQDLASNAKDSWYTRHIDLSTIAGKTIIGVALFNSSNLAGNFDIYLKNCYLNSRSGTPFFGITQTTPSLNPPIVASIGAYVTSATLTTVVPVHVASASSRISPAYSIDSVKLIKDTLITWSALEPTTGPNVIAGSPGAATVAGNITIFASYDGTTWLPCTNNQALPGLPTGANCAGLSLYLLETFTGGQDPSAIPALLQVNVALTSAPVATTVDSVNYYGTTAQWNTGVEEGAVPNSNGDLALGPTTYTWANLSDMTFVPGYIVDVDVTLPVQSVSSGAYVITSVGDSDGDSWSSTRLNFISAVQNFTVQADFTLSGSTPLQNEVGFLYRQTYWGSPNDSFAYYVRIMQNSGGGAGGTSITLGYGLNSPPSQGTSIYSSGPYTVLAQVGVTISSGTAHHIKVVVGGTRHTIYWNNNSTPIIDLLDSTYTTAGNIGLRTYVNAGNTNTMTTKIANFSVTNTYAGIWTSPSINLSSLATCGNTQVAWSEVTAQGGTQSTAVVLASLDAGATWQQCTNGALAPTVPIPGLTNGTSVTGKSLLIQVILSTTDFLTSPIITGLSVRICGVYPGCTGVRTTSPLANDTMIRSNVVGALGPGFDGQSYTKVGTATVNLTSNEAVLSNTTGDLHMVYGSRIWTDEDATCRISLSSSTVNAGMELRYNNTGSLYRFSITTTTLTLTKVSGGVTATLVIAVTSLAINTYYRLRFRVLSSNPAYLSARVWTDATLEPTVWGVTAPG